MKIITAFLVALSLSCSAGAVEENNLAMMGFYSSGDEIINKLDNNEAGYKEHFLLGRVYRKNREFKKAILHFTNSCFKYSNNLKLKLFPYPVYRYLSGFHIKSEYYDDSVYEIALLFYEYREFEYISRFIDLIPESNTALYRDAVILKSNAMIELERYNDAIVLLEKLLFKYTDIESKSLIHIRIASAYERNRDYPNAIKEYFSVLRMSENLWQSGIACGRILGLQSEFNYNLTDDEKLLLAAALYHNTNIKESKIILEELINAQLDDKSLTKALEYYILTCIRADKLIDADKIILKYKDNSSLYVRLLEIKADALWENNKKGHAFQIYQKLKIENTDSIKQKSYNRILQYLTSRRNSGFEKVLLEFKEKYPGDKSLEIYLWDIAKNKLKARDQVTAIKYLEESINLFPAGNYSGRSRYWLSKLYLSSGRKEEALQKAVEMTVKNPDSAYTWKKLEQIKDDFPAEELKTKFRNSINLKNQEDAIFYNALLFLKERDFIEREKRIFAMDFFSSVRQYKEIKDIIKKPDQKSKYIDSFNKTEKYFTVGYSEGINRELGLISLDKGSLLEKFKALSFFGSKYTNYYYTVRSIQEILKLYNLSENIMLLPKDVVEKLFPRAFIADVNDLCSEFNIPSEMVYAVMKAESTFNHRAVSSAGAEGIMQLMHPTAKGIAREMKMKEYDLKDPVTSINFGIKYLAWLNKMFNKDFENMVAGYNAGAGNVKKWLKEVTSSDADYFIEFIPFEETKNYILRTNKYFNQYKMIYGSKPSGI